MTATAPTLHVPLFPLNTVLFPEGELNLRIFEPRYLDMVRDCARSGSSFGVCLILQGRDVGEAAVPAAVGTLAHIVDFGTTQDGLLSIRAKGGGRFRLQQSRVRDNGLARGDVQLWPDDSHDEVPAEFLLLSTILDRLLEKLGGPHASAPRDRFNDAGWVAFRLAESLPIENTERQQLLQTAEPLERLAQLMHYLPRFQAG